MNPEKLIQIKDKITKLINLGESESKLGNEGAAILIAEKVQQLMADYQLEEKDFYKEHPEIKYEPLIGISKFENPFLSRRPIEYRKPWAEYLASCIALGNLCKVTVNSKSGELSFYGVDFNRDIAILMFEKITSIALEACRIEMEKAKSLIGKKTLDMKTKKIVEYPKVWLGDAFFIDNFMFGFGSKLRENYNELFEQNSDLFARIDEFISKTSTYNQIDASIFDIQLGKNIDVQNLGRKYGNFTAKNKSSNVQKNANIQLSKKIDENKPLDDRIGEVWMLIDASGSMAGDKIQSAKTGALDFALDAITKKFAVGIIEFGFDFYKPSSIICNTQLEIDDKWKSELNKLHGSGGTPMLSAIQLAANQWNSYNRLKKVIVLVTDGQPTDSPKETIIEYGKLLKASGIQIMTIGTYDADGDFLKELSSGKETLQVSDSEIRNALRGMAGYLSA